MMKQETENRNENLIPLRTYDEIVVNKSNLLPERNWKDIDITGLLLDFTRPYTSPRWGLSRLGTYFAKLGDLHFVGGKPGGGKTSFLAQIVVTYLKGFFGETKCELKTDKPIVILFVDTEQSEDDSIATKNRICTMAGINYNERSDVFFFARLRETVKAEDRYRQILKLIYEIQPTVLFIDGMLDLVEDYNSQEECTPIIRELMIVATAYNISIWCVLHENLTIDKMVGVLGSIAQRKSTEVFIVRVHNKDLDKKVGKDYPNFPEIFYSVEAIKTRGKYIKKWYFEILDKCPWGMPREIMTTPKNDSQDIITDPIINALRNLLPNGRSQKYGQIKDCLVKECGVADDNKIIRSIIKEAVDMEMLNIIQLADREVFSFNHSLWKDNERPF